jgi:DNA polymerase
MDESDRATLERIILQHAESARLMGVDFVPVYRAGGAGSGNEESVGDGSGGAGEGEPAPLEVVVPPRVGRAGQLLEKMINAMGLARGQVYIANVLKTRPPDNATPTSEEIRLCAPYLYQQIALVQPEAIVTLGLPASRALLNSVESMSRLRGRWSSFQAPAPCSRGIPVMPTYHPAFLLRSYTPENRAKVWSDLQMVMERLGMKGAPAAGG